MCVSNQANISKSQPNTNAKQSLSIQAHDHPQNRQNGSTAIEENKNTQVLPKRAQITRYAQVPDRAPNQANAKAYPFLALDASTK